MRKPFIYHNQDTGGGADSTENPPIKPESITAGISNSAGDTGNVGEALSRFFNTLSDTIGSNNNGAASGRSRTTEGGSVGNTGEATTNGGTDNGGAPETQERPPAKKPRWYKRKLWGAE